jgi:hypothetical protein
MVDFWTNHFNVFAGKELIDGYCLHMIATLSAEFDDFRRC